MFDIAYAKPFHKCMAMVIWFTEINCLSDHNARFTSKRDQRLMSWKTRNKFAVRAQASVYTDTGGRLSCEKTCQTDPNMGVNWDSPEKRFRAHDLRNTFVSLSVWLGPQHPKSRSDHRDWPPTDLQCLPTKLPICDLGVTVSGFHDWWRRR